MISPADIVIFFTDGAHLAGVWALRIVIGFFFIFTAFIDDFPFSLLTFGMVGATIAVGFELLGRRLASILSIIKRTLGREGQSSAKQQIKDYKTFALYCLQLIGLSILGAISFQFSLGPFLDVMAGNRPPADFSMLSFFGSLWNTTECSLWHSWKGIPEYFLQLVEKAASFVGHDLPRPSQIFSYSCGEWFARYSVVIRFLVFPLLLMSVVMGIKVTWWRVRKTHPP